eukprot:1161266-Pelagomonas_calceolata.AAC.13
MDTWLASIGAQLAQRNLRGGPAATLPTWADRPGAGTFQRTEAKIVSSKLKNQGYRREQRKENCLNKT